nr:HAD family phosphatase [Caldovatus aquaticus]
MFDCDGVLADSEALVNRLVAEERTARGWRMTAAEARETFLGMALPDMVPAIEARTGPLPPGWGRGLSERIARALREEVAPVPGAIAAVRAVAAAGIPIACASNSARLELTAKLERLGLAPLFGARVLSFEDVPRPKPAGDLYRAAAAACGADPAACVAVEDSLLGVRAALAAGCGRVLGLADEAGAALLAGLGAEPLPAMAALPGLLGLDSPEGEPGC